MLIIHIGLPKTATTFLQRQIFRRSFEDRYFHWLTARQVRHLRDGCQHNRPLDNEYFRSAGTWLREIFGPKPTMIACENISSQGEGFWRGDGPSPLEIGKTLETLRDWALIRPADFKIILGVRRQDQMLASRYAQRAFAGQPYSQHDFEQRALSIVQDSSRKPGHSWLYYDEVVEALTQCIGPNNVFIYSQEEMDRQLDQTLERMSVFCATNFHGALKASREEGLVRSVGRKSRVVDRWRIGTNKTDFTLDSVIKNKIIDHFRHSNTVFERQTGCHINDVTALG